MTFKQVDDGTLDLVFQCDEGHEHRYPPEERENWTDGVGTFDQEMFALMVLTPDCEAFLDGDTDDASDGDPDTDNADDADDADGLEEDPSDDD